MSLSIPYTFTGGPGNKAKASQVNANFQAVVSKFTEGVGGIANADIAANAGVKASKLSVVPGERIATANLEDDAVTAAKVADGAIDAAAKIVDGIITKAKLLAGTLTKAQTAITVSSITLSGGLLSATASRTFHGPSFSPVIPAPASAIMLGLWVENASDTWPNNLAISPYVDTTGVTNGIAILNTHGSTARSYDGVVVKVAWIPVS